LEDDLAREELSACEVESDRLIAWIEEGTPAGTPAGTPVLPEQLHLIHDAAI
jgi:hypothetical protein